jgi:RNA polymerase sigma-70 factor (ECF subfamily)
MRSGDEIEALETLARSDVARALPDQEVVRRVLSGDTAVFEVIMRRYNQRLYRAVRGILRDEAEAEDVVQEAYLRSLRHLRDFQWRSSFATWLTRIAVYEACARRRRRRRGVRGLPGDGSEGRARFDPDSAEVTLRRGEAGRAFRDLIDSLPASLRVVLVLRVVEGLDTHETAECLGLSDTNVKVRLHRARAVLQKQIAAELRDELQHVYAFDGPRCDRMVRGVFARQTTGLQGALQTPPAARSGSTEITPDRGSPGLQRDRQGHPAGTQPRRRSDRRPWSRTPPA